jgi:3-oxoacyl-[acyl-carrier protein] reductase
MIPAGLSEDIRAQLLDPRVVVPPLLCLASAESDGITGRRLVANRWDPNNPASAMEDAGWI